MEEVMRYNAALLKLLAQVSDAARAGDDEAVRYLKGKAAEAWNGLEDAVDRLPGGDDACSEHLLTDCPVCEDK